MENGQRTISPKISKKNTSLQRHVQHIVHRFNVTGSVIKGKSTGRPQVDENIVDQVEALVEENRHSPLRRVT